MEDKFNPERDCWFCGSEVANRTRRWQHFCDAFCRSRYGWWDGGWQRRYGVDINLWAILDAQRHECALCGDFLGRSWEIDHIIPLDSGGETKVENLQALCSPCNKGKWVLTVDEYIEHCKRVIAFSETKARAANG